MKDNVISLKEYKKKKDRKKHFYEMRKIIFSGVNKGKEYNLEWRGLYSNPILLDNK